MSNHANDNVPRLMSLNEICALLGVSRTFVNQQREKRRFPQAVDLGERKIMFVRSEVEAWISDRIAARAVQAAA